MEMIVKKIIGLNTYTFVFTGSNLYEAVTESQKLSFPDVHKCGICGSDELVLGTHLGKDEKGNDAFKYTDIKCGKCKASLTFGNPKKDPDTFYLRKNDKNEYDWKPYVQEQSQPPAAPVNKPASKPQTKTATATDKNDKPSGKAINYGIKISTAKSPEALNDICGKVKTMDFNKIDQLYLNNECMRKRNLFNSSQA